MTSHIQVCMMKCKETGTVIKNQPHYMKKWKRIEKTGIKMVKLIEIRAVMALGEVK